MKYGLARWRGVHHAEVACESVEDHAYPWLGVQSVWVPATGPERISMAHEPSNLLQTEDNGKKKSGVNI